MTPSNQTNCNQTGPEPTCATDVAHLPPDMPLPPRKKQKSSVGEQPAATGSPGCVDKQQAAADAVYHASLALPPDKLDFVRKDEQWPAIRTSTNTTAVNYDTPRKKGDWSTQRSRFIKQVFLTMYADSESDEDTLLDLMFNGGKYDWLCDTARVIRAVQARYNGNTRAKAFTALFQLCEVKCGAYLAERSFDEEYKAAKLVYIDMQKNPDKPTQTEYKAAVMMLGYITMIMAAMYFSPSAAVAVTSCSVIARAVKQKAYAALDAEDSAGCPPKKYAGSVPNTEERRIWEAAAQQYYQLLLDKYQAAIENLRLDVVQFLSQENLDVSVFLDRHHRLAKKTGLKQGLAQTRAYFALATLYGEANGTYEPQRLDWYRAQFATCLPDGWELVWDASTGKFILPDPNPLPSTCMFVLITEQKVVMVLRGGNKNGQNVDQDLTDVAPKLAAMLRHWMTHARSAQPALTHPFVTFKTEEASYGTGCADSGVYSKMIERAWKIADLNPQEDADKETAANDRHGLGCDWARKVTDRARRGVVCKIGEERDNAGACAQGHNANTERAKYRTL